MIVGVLALQGDFIEHIAVLEKLGAAAIPVRKPEELTGLDGLIIPGGESTTMLNLMHSFSLFEPLKELAKSGLPVMGTCAGMILLARKVSGSDMDTLAVMDMEVRRNAFGRQADSFEAELAMPVLGQEPVPAIFIRAPLILSTGPKVEILARLADGGIVAARQGTLLAAAFHPELSSDPRLHHYFLKTFARRRRASRRAAIPAG
jgi:5'-phosphate synthase pdxT subunit